MSSMPVKKQKVTKAFALYCGDCCEVLPNLPDESVGLCVFSPPFADLYTYTDDPKDMSNCRSYDEFFEHFTFLVEQLERLMMPGRIVAVHCMELSLHKSRGEEIGIRDFPGDIVRCFLRFDFVQHSPRITIWKDPLTAAVRTKAIGLAHKQIIKDSAFCRTGIPDYVIAFRKRGENSVPVKHERGLTEYYGSRKVPTKLDRYLVEDVEQKHNKRSHWIWQQYASPVWSDIRQTYVLEYREARDGDDEKHICLARDSRVLVKKRGYVPIQLVETSDRVLTHKGRWRRVLAVECTGINPVVTVRSQGVPGLTVTPDHKLWARKSDWIRQRDGAERVDATWVEAENCLGSYLNLKLPEEEEPINLNPLHWWIVGRWLADGCWGAKGEALIGCGYHELGKLIDCLGDHAGTVSDCGTANQIRLRDRGGKVRAILERCGIGAVGKHLPPGAFTLPSRLAKSLVDGYLSGDGHLLEDRQRWTASSVSRDLLMGLAMLIQRAYGSIASVYAGRPAREGMIEGRLVQCEQEWILSFDLVGDGRRKRQFIVNDGAWKKVRSVEDAGRCETWNLRVEEDESYTAEGCVVKNCPLQLDVIERCVALWSARGDVVLSPFMGVGSEVYVAVKNHRKAIGVELKESYFDQALKNLESLRRSREVRLKP